MNLIDDLGASAESPIGYLMQLDYNEAGRSKKLGALQNLEEAYAHVVAGGDIKLNSSAKRGLEEIAGGPLIYDKPSAKWFKRRLVSIPEHYHLPERGNGVRLKGGGHILFAIAIFSAYIVSQQVYADAERGLDSGSTVFADSLTQNVGDFIRHARMDDIPMADLDAAVAAGEYHNSTAGDPTNPADALTFWNGLQTYEQ
jgi:hypothetical protein